MKNIVFFSFLVLVAFQQLFAYNLKSPNGNLILKIYSCRQWNSYICSIVGRQASNRKQQTWF